LILLGAQLSCICFAGSLIIADQLRHLHVRFDLRAHLLDLRRLFVEALRELRNCRWEISLLLRYFRV
jgi:hypothetical protein